MNNGDADALVGKFQALEECRRGRRRTHTVKAGAFETGNLKKP